jgi:hypothetical protein
MEISADTLNIMRKSGAVALSLVAAALAFNYLGVLPLSSVAAVILWIYLLGNAGLAMPLQYAQHRAKGRHCPKCGRELRIKHEYDCPDCGSWKLDASEPLKPL